MNRIPPSHLIVLLAAGCSRTIPVPPTAADGPGAVEVAVCAGRPRCAVESELPVGPAIAGRVRSIVVARLPRRPRTTDHGIHGPLTEEPWARYLVYGEAASPNPECTPWETWLVSRSGGEASREQLLVATCAPDDDDRAPVIESTGPEVVRSTVTAQTGNGAAKSLEGYSEDVETLTFGLDPPRIQRVERRRGYGLPGRELVPDTESSWDWEVFRGHACWHGHDDCAEILPVAHVADDGGFDGGAWKATALGTCSLLLDGTPAHGIAEPPITPTASVRALLADDVFYLEVTDDSFVTQGPVVDAVEVRWSSYEAKPGDHPTVERLTMDGTLRRRGSTQPIDFAEAGPNTRRFAMKGVWPPDLGAWSLSYVDTDDGRTIRQRLSLASGSGMRGQTVLRVEPGATCVPKDGMLHPAPATATERDKAIVP